MTAPVKAGHASGAAIRGAGLLRAGFALTVLAYFVHFAGPSLSGRFNADDPMNLYYYWSRGPWKLMLNLPLFFTTYQRPMGGVYFATLYGLFGLNPLPYHIVIVALLLVNTYLAYRFGRLITGSELCGGLAALMTAYHAEMAQTVYLPAFIFDVLCFTFYFLALNYYLAIRMRGERLTRKQVVVFVVLFIAALDSKEMAVTLPVIVLLYEAIWRRPSRLRAPDIVAWLRRDGLPALIAGGITAVFILGKRLGPRSVADLESYRQTFTLDRYWESTTRFVNTIFYQPIAGGFFTSGRVLLLAAILLYVAWRRKDKHLILMWLFVWITPLPITFVAGRGGALLSIPAVGWAVIIATFFLSLCGAAARLFARLRVPAPAATAIVVILGVAALWSWTESRNWDTYRGMQDGTELTWNVIQQVRSVQPAVRSGSKVYVANDVFEGWDTKFIMELVWGDRTVNVWLASQSKLSREEIEGMDYIFTFENGKLKRVKGA